MTCEPSTLLTAVVLGAAVAGSPVAMRTVRNWRDRRRNDGT